MKVRGYEEADLEQLRRIHRAQGFGYAFPDLRNPLFLTKLVLVGDPGREVGELCGHGAPPFVPQGEQCCASTQSGDRSGQRKPVSENRIVGAALLRLTAEAYLLLDPKVGTPRERWEWLLRLHAATEQEATRRGLEDVHAWLPPEIAAKFGKRLTRVGWIRDDVWTPYCRRLR